MNNEEVLDWLLANPFVIGYFSALTIASLACFFVMLFRSSDADPMRGIRLSAWQIQPVDFALFMVSLILWFIFSGAFYSHIYGMIYGSEQIPGAGANLLGGFLLQGGMLYLFLRFRSHFRTDLEESLNPSGIGWIRSVGTGLFYFLATLPVIYGVSALWQVLIDFLRDFGWNLDLPTQDAVMLFREADHPLMLAGLIFLAIVVAPVVEEFVFRGGVYRFLRGRTWRPIALLLSGSLFGIIHGNLQSLPGLITVGICLAVAYERTASLRVAIFFHACFNLNSIIWLLILPDNLN